MNQGDYHYDEASFNKVMTEMNHTIINNAKNIEDLTGQCREKILERVTGIKSYGTEELKAVNLPLLKVFMKKQVIID